MKIRPVEHHEIADAFAVLTAVASWLDARGSRQRIARTTLATYQSWQAESGNHVVCDGDRFVGIFTVVRDGFAEWPAMAAQTPVLWLRALATHPDARGRDVGPRAIAASLAMTPADEHLWLDCVSGFLPTYYARHGFETIAEQVRDYEDDGPLPLTLMRQPGRGTT